jgi:lipoate-protein ligase A
LEEAFESKRVRWRWYRPATTALVVGFAQRLRADSLIDAARCKAAGIEVLTRRAGGGLVLLGPDTLCFAIAFPLPHPLVVDDLTESYRWLGYRLTSGLHALGVSQARRIEVAEARADTSRLAARAAESPVDRLVRATCFGGLSPHEIVVANAKLVGLAQVRRRHAVLYQVGILLEDQSHLAYFVQTPDESAREGLRRTLSARTVGLHSLTSATPEQVVSVLDAHLNL